MEHVLNISSWLAPALFALLGAWLGTRLALNKFKRERAFDRRLDWHVRALRLLHRLEQVSAQARAIESPDSPELNAAQRRFSSVAAEAPAYMTLNAARSLRLAERQYWHAHFQVRKFLESGEDSEVVSQAHGSESAALGTAETALLSGIHRLMPPESEYSWWQRSKARLRRIVRKPKAIKP